MKCIHSQWPDTDIQFWNQMRHLGAMPRGLIDLGIAWMPLYSLFIQYTRAWNYSAAEIAHFSYAQMCAQWEKTHAVHFRMGFSNSRIIQIYFSPTNNINRAENKTFSWSVVYLRDNLFSNAWQNEMKSKNKVVFFPAITYIKFHQGWKVFLRCFEDGIGGFAITGFLCSQLTISVTENYWRGSCHCYSLLQYRLHWTDRKQASVWTLRLAPTQQILSISHVLPTATTGGLRRGEKKKKKGWFPKQQQLAHCIILFLYAKLDTCETKQLIAVCDRE